jgi:hypothetical protein
MEQRMTKAKKENRAPKDEEQQLTNAELDTVNGGTRANKAQSDITSKYSQFHDGVAQNFK